MTCVHGLLLATWHSKHMFKIYERWYTSRLWRTVSSITGELSTIGMWIGILHGSGCIVIYHPWLLPIVWTNTSLIERSWLFNYILWHANSSRMCCSHCIRKHRLVGIYIKCVESDVGPTGEVDEMSECYVIFLCCSDTVELFAQY